MVYYLAIGAGVWAKGFTKAEAIRGMNSQSGNSPSHKQNHIMYEFPEGRFVVWVDDMGGVRWDGKGAEEYKPKKEYFTVKPKVKRKV